MRLVLLGPPGAGKGTQAHRMADRYGLSLISTGDIFRRNVEHGTELGTLAKSYMDAGELVPDDVVLAMVVDALVEAEGRFILDGFPRNAAQAEALEEELDQRQQPIDAVLAFLLPDEVAVKRLAGRRTCGECQRTYNVELHPPGEEGVCDVCGGALMQREDDQEVTVTRRLEVYHQSTQPLVEYYRSLGRLRQVDADGTEDEVDDGLTGVLKAVSAQATARP